VRLESSDVEIEMMGTTALSREIINVADRWALACEDHPSKLNEGGSPAGDARGHVLVFEVLLDTVKGEHGTNCPDPHRPITTPILLAIHCDFEFDRHQVAGPAPVSVLGHCSRGLTYCPRDRPH